jgi:hypothetical protein
MTSRKLDQFYTKREAAQKCYKIVSDIIDIEKYKLIEPSAGNGSFSDLFHNNFIALDLEPKKNYIIQQDFFDFNFNNSEEKVIVIGNPPFGKNSSLAIKFFNKSAVFSDYICMVLPKTFKKESVINKLNNQFHLLKELELEKFSFTFKEEDYDVPCVFQIWEKRSEIRKKMEQQLISKFFIFTNKQNADIAIRRVGGLAGKVIEDFQKYKEPSHYYIKINPEYDKNNFIKILKECYKEFAEKAKNSAGNPSLSKHELITTFELKIIKYQIK